jgi:DNA-binding XRE family transcriptional regulator
MLREKYGAGSSYCYPMPEGWRCATCGCTAEKAHRNRVARGLAPLKSRQQTCSPECARMLRVTPEREAQRAAREVWRIERSVRRERMRRMGERGVSPIYSLAVNVRRLRLAFGMTQEALARHAGVARSSIAMIETARIKGPRPAVLERLARALGTTASKLTVTPQG